MLSQCNGTGLKEHFEAEHSEVVDLIEGLNETIKYCYTLRVKVREGRFGEITQILAW